MKSDIIFTYIQPSLSSSVWTRIIYNQRSTLVKRKKTKGEGIFTIYKSFRRRNIEYLPKWSWCISNIFIRREFISSRIYIISLYQHHKQPVVYMYNNLWQWQSCLSFQIPNALYRLDDLSSLIQVSYFFLSKSMPYVSLVQCLRLLSVNRPCWLLVEIGFDTVVVLYQICFWNELLNTL